MLVYRCRDNMIQLRDGDRHWEIEFPGRLTNRFTSAGLSWDHRYVVFGNDRGIPAGSPQGTKPPEGIHGVWLYDLETSCLQPLPHQIQPSDVYWDAAFSRDGTLFFSDGNTFWRWRPGDTRTEKIYRFQKVKSAPMGVGISGDGRYLSYYKFRSDDMRFHLYDTQTGEDRDLRFSVFRYGWLDDTQIAWTKSAGLKVLDVENGKNKTLLRDCHSVLKKCSRGDALRIEPFSKLENIYQEMPFLGSQDGRIWFRLRLSSLTKTPERHDGIWSVSADGKELRFHYDVPEDYNDGFYSDWFRSGCVGWANKNEEFQLWDGESRSSLPVGWKPVILPKDLRR